MSSNTIDEAVLRKNNENLQLLFPYLLCELANFCWGVGVGSLPFTGKACFVQTNKNLM